MSRLQQASDVIAGRLRLWAALQLRHREMGDMDITLALAELWEPADQAALEEYEQAKAEAMGQIALPFGE